MTSTLDLDPEWGAIDLFEEVEATFGIKIGNEEAERCCTVGDLYEIVCAHAPNWDGQDGFCGSSMVFYRLRASLSPDDKRGFVPETSLTASALQPNRLFKKLAFDTGLRLPANELTRPGKTGGVLFAGGILAAIVALLTGHWMISGIAGLIACTGLPLLWLDPGRFPTGIVSVGDLVRRTVPLNVASLMQAGGRPADRWSVLVALAAEYGVIPPDEIRPGTFLHRKSLELATAS